MVVAETRAAVMDEWTRGAFPALFETMPGVQMGEAPRPSGPAANP